MIYRLAGEALVPDFRRACGHPYLLEAGDCELCDIDWLLETKSGEDPEELFALRQEWVEERRAQRGER